jgi:hypothetical protein
MVAILSAKGSVARKRLLVTRRAPPQQREGDSSRAMAQKMSRSPCQLRTRSWVTGREPSFSNLRDILKDRSAPPLLSTRRPRSGSRRSVHLLAAAQPPYIAQKKARCIADTPGQRDWSVRRGNSNICFPPIAAVRLPCIFLGVRTRSRTRDHETLLLQNRRPSRCARSRAG